ncbi:hypothetical protein LZ30DRAFT_250021 [Colletotrichum cereale]|nr:hypothetical protein LZ30DRAFT_250021 [Colletotrichum cereale]
MEGDSNRGRGLLYSPSFFPLPSPSSPFFHYSPDFGLFFFRLSGLDGERECVCGRESERRASSRPSQRARPRVYPPSDPGVTWGGSSSTLLLSRPSPPMPIHSLRQRSSPPTSVLRPPPQFKPGVPVRRGWVLGRRGRWTSRPFRTGPGGLFFDSVNGKNEFQ